MNPDQLLRNYKLVQQLLSARMHFLGDQADAAGILDECDA